MMGSRGRKENTKRDEEKQAVCRLHYCMGSMHKDDRPCTWEKGLCQALERSVLGQTCGLLIELIYWHVWATMMGSKITKMGLKWALIWIQIDFGLRYKLNGPWA